MQTKVPIEVPKSKIQIKAGETVYLVASIGEGYWDAWYRNEVIPIQDYQTNYSTLIQIRPVKTLI